MRLPMLALTGCLTAACSLSSTPSPPTTTYSTAPAGIQLFASTRPDQTLSVRAIVFTSGGVGVPNVPVTFSVDTGIAVPLVVTTDDAGAASTIVGSSSTVHITAAGAGLSQTIMALGTLPPLTISSLFVTHGESNVRPTIFVASVVGLPDGATRYVWEFGDGKDSQTTTVPTISYQYLNESGLFFCSVTVTDSLGRTARATTYTSVGP